MADPIVAPFRPFRTRPKGTAASSFNAGFSKSAGALTPTVGRRGASPMSQGGGIIVNRKVSGGGAPTPIGPYEPPAAPTVGSRKPPISQGLGLSRPKASGGGAPSPIGPYEPPKPKAKPTVKPRPLRSNAGGMVKGKARAAQVQAMNRQRQAVTMKKLNHK